MRLLSIIFVSVMMIGVVAGPALAKDEIGSLVALRGKATIERSRKTLDAKVKGQLYLHDVIRTGDSSRAKILFIDDSVLTMSEKSRVSIDEFIHNKDARGKSVFNLLDGKMRAVVGKTRFEVRTPTAVAAARGTVIFFQVGEINGKAFTQIIALEGTVDVKSASPGVPGGVVLTPGMMVTIFADGPVPTPVPAPPAELDKIKKDAAGTTVNGPTQVGSNDAPVIVTPVQQQPQQPTKAHVIIRVK